jgi:hypothetical protein
MHKTITTAISGLGLLFASTADTAHRIVRTLRWTAGMSMLASLAMAGSAAATPAVSLAIPDSNAGSPMTYSYTSASVPRAAKLVIQRAMGTAEHFGTVATLAHTRTGTGRLPAQQLGQYSFRIAVVGEKKVGRHGHKHYVEAVLAQKKARAKVYGTLTFEQYFQKSEQTFTLPTRTFTYTFVAGFGTDSANVLSISASANSCRSVHADWVPDDDDPNDTPTPVELSVVQESVDAITDTAVDQEISAVDATVAPAQSWGINIISLAANQRGLGYINGTVSCYTPTGQLS